MPLGGCFYVLMWMTKFFSWSNIFVMLYYGYINKPSLFLLANFVVELYVFCIYFLLCILKKYVEMKKKKQVILSELYLKWFFCFILQAHISDIASLNIKTKCVTLQFYVIIYPILLSLRILTRKTHFQIKLKR